MFLNKKQTLRSGQSGFEASWRSCTRGPKTGIEVGVTCCHLTGLLQQDPFNLIGCSCFTHKKLQELEKLGVLEV